MHKLVMSYMFSVFKVTDLRSTRLKFALAIHTAENTRARHNLPKQEQAIFEQN